MNFCWTLMSLPPMLRTCPILIIAIASYCAGVRRAVRKLPKPSPGKISRSTVPARGYYSNISPVAAALAQLTHGEPAHHHGGHECSYPKAAAEMKQGGELWRCSLDLHVCLVRPPDVPQRGRRPRSTAGLALE